MSASSSPTPASADDAPPARRTVRLLRFWPYFAISGLWVVVALIFGAQQSYSSQRPPSKVFIGTLLEWLPWILLSPALFAVATRFPLKKGRLLLACSVHLVVTLFCLATAEAVFMALHKQSKATATPRLTGRDDPDSFRPARRRPPPPPDDEFGPPEGAPDRRPDPYFDFDDERPRPAPRGRARDADAPGNNPGGPGRHVLQFHLPIALFVLMAAQANAALASLRERERRAAELAASLTQAQLAALQSQLQPHFLFNALNALATVVHRDANQADEMINNLADLLRRSLAAGKRPEVTLGDELDHLSCYLSIERVRFGDRLQVDWRIDEAARPALIPVLALQPILENAVKHGVERRRETVGRILITATADAGRLRVTITDNGPGPDLDSSAAPAPVRPGHGIGLANTRARLRALHGDAASVTLEPASGGGCRVTVILPLRFAPASPSVSAASVEPPPASATSPHS